MGCEVNILRMTEYIKEEFENKKYKGLWITFIDLKSAFDTVNHELLFEKMNKLGIKDKTINTIRWLYEQTKIKTRYNEIKLGQGVI